MYRVQGRLIPFLSDVGKFMTEEWDRHWMVFVFNLSYLDLGSWVLVLKEGVKWQTNNLRSSSLIQKGHLCPTAMLLQKDSLWSDIFSLGYISLATLRISIWQRYALKHQCLQAQKCMGQHGRGPYLRQNFLVSLHFSCLFSFTRHIRSQSLKAKPVIHSISHSLMGVPSFPTLNKHRRTLPNCHVC